MIASVAEMKLASDNGFARKLVEHSLPLRHTRTEILQINVGKLCNLTCIHCHVNAGPKRKEIMTRETIDRVIDWLAKTDIPTVDLTGGAPEMIPDFKYLVERLKALTPPRHIIDRCNLTILLEPGFEDYAQFLARHRSRSLPRCRATRPRTSTPSGAKASSMAASKGLQLLNSLGYGIDPALPLHLVYNPNGAFLPGPQAELEADYKRELKDHFGIVFNKLFTITNLPIARFASWLRNNGQLADYMALLNDAFNPATVNGLMCRNTISVSWRGEVFDCDFNQMLKMQWRDGDDRALSLWDIDPAAGRESRNPDRRALLRLHRRRRLKLRRRARLDLERRLRATAPRCRQRALRGFARRRRWFDRGCDRRRSRRLRGPAVKGRERSCTQFEPVHDQVVFWSMPPSPPPKRITVFRFGSKAAEPP